MISVIEEVDAIFHIESILTPEEIRDIQNKEIIETTLHLKGRTYQLSIRIQQKWDEI